MARRTSLKVKPTKDGVYKLGKAHLAVYTKAVEEFVGWFGLSEWKLWVIIEPHDNAYGFCRADCPNQCAVIGLTPEWDVQPTEKELRKVALHEVFELLLAPMWHAVLARSLDENWANSQRHTIIRRLENISRNMI